MLLSAISLIYRGISEKEIWPRKYDFPPIMSVQNDVACKIEPVHFYACLIYIITARPHEQV